MLLRNPRRLKPPLHKRRYRRVRRHQSSIWEPEKSDSDAPYKDSRYRQYIISVDIVGASPSVIYLGT